jgi:hypothetical protein
MIRIVYCRWNLAWFSLLSLSRPQAKPTGFSADHKNWAAVMHFQPLQLTALLTNI